MTEFTASNGAQIVLTNSGQTGYVLTENEERVSSAYLGFEEMVAWREFEQHRRDEDLGRWRWPENPDYVVYSNDPVARLRVVRESDGFVALLDEATDDAGYSFQEAARAYFEAHPERKPWEEAKPGEVWLFRGKGDIKPSAFMKSHVGWTNSEAVVVQRDPALPYGGTRDESFKPRRIWPEDAS